MKQVRTQKVNNMPVNGRDMSTNNEGRRLFGHFRALNWPDFLLGEKCFFQIVVFCIGEIGGTSDYTAIVGFPPHPQLHTLYNWPIVKSPPKKPSCIHTKNVHYGTTPISRNSIKSERIFLFFCQNEGCGVDLPCGFVKETMLSVSMCNCNNNYF